MPDLTCVAPTVCAALGVPAPRQATGEPLPEALRELEGCARLALVVLDGLGMATWRAAPGRMPVLEALACDRLVEIRSVLPAVTPVCLAAMGTGCTIEIHQVREREDPFRAETIFEVIREAGRTSGVAGAAAASATRVLGRWSDVTRRVAKAENREALILAAGLRVIEEDRPDFFFTQFLGVDTASHKYGPFTPETAAAAADLDRRFARLLQGLKAKGYAVIALADHGQHPIDPPISGKRGWHDGSVEEDMIVPLVWASAEQIPLDAN